MHNQNTPKSSENQRAIKYPKPDKFKLPECSKNTKRAIAELYPDSEKVKNTLIPQVKDLLDLINETCDPEKELDVSGIQDILKSELAKQLGFNYKPTGQGTDMDASKNMETVSRLRTDLTGVLDTHRAESEELKGGEFLNMFIQVGAIAKIDCGFKYMGNEEVFDSQLERFLKGKFLILQKNELLTPSGVIPNFDNELSKKELETASQIGIKVEDNQVNLAELIKIYSREFSREFTEKMETK